MRAAQRTARVNPFRVMNVISRAAELERGGRSICHLEVGEPDFVTAPAILEAGRAALASGRTGYTEAAGLPALRERISDWYARRYGLDVAPARIFVTPGASGALSLAAQMLHDPGDGVLLPDPGYPCNRNFISLAGAEPQLVPLDAAAGWRLDVAALEARCRDNTRALWIASPSNPTGGTMSLQELEIVVDWTRHRDMTLVSDEIYHGLEYGEHLPSALQLATEPVVVNSFSKYFGMTGWRIGWLVVPEALVEVTNRLAQNLFIAAPTVSQYAALRAFDDDVIEVLESRRLAFRERRDFLTRALLEMGFTLPSAGEGAFYLYAGIGRFAADSEVFCRDLLEEHGVALTPGTDFGEHGGRGHVRLAFTTGMDALEMAVERMYRALV